MKLSAASRRRAIAFGLNHIRAVAFRASQDRLNRLAALDWKKGNKEKGKVVYPAHFFEDLGATAFGTVFLTF